MKVLSSCAFNTHCENPPTCPSEIARWQFPDDWRDRMEITRRAARWLVDAGKLKIVQGGRVVDPSAAKGAIRLRLRR